MSARKKIERICKNLGLTIVALTYDPAITYETGGWDLVVTDDDGQSHHSYGAHTYTEILNDLTDQWTPKAIEG